jgi:hypothetical protein
MKFTLKFFYYKRIAIAFTFITNYKPGRTKFPKIQKPPQSSRYQKCDMNKFPYLGPANIRRHLTEFSRHGDLTLGICAPLMIFVSADANTTLFIRIGLYFVILNSNGPSRSA